MYEKTTWESREGEGLDKYLKFEETPESVTLINAPDSITREGTPFSSENMDHIEEGIEAAHNLIAEETQARTDGDTAVLDNAKNYADEQIADTVAATQKWLPAVDTAALLPAITDTSRSWLCRVRGEQAVYQCVAGQTGWLLYSDGNDFVNELELESGISAHNQGGEAHPDIRSKITTDIAEHDGDETAHPDIREDIEAEEQARIEADDNLQNQINILLSEGIESLPNELATRLQCHYHEESEVIHLNDYRDPGIYIFADPAPGSTGFPLDWGTGPDNAAILEVLPFHQDIAVQQIISKRGTNLSYKRYSTSPTNWSNVVDWELVSGHKVGALYIQWPNTKTPYEEGLTGQWALWNHRAELYGLSQDKPEAALDYMSLVGASITALGTGTIRAVAAGDNGKFVAVGDSGKIYFGDGATWVTVNNHPFGTSAIHCVAYGNGYYIAAGDGGKMAKSEDGVNWTSITTHTFGTTAIYSIIAPERLISYVWMAAGASGKVSYSGDDGATWTSATHTLGTGNLWKVYFYNSRIKRHFIAGASGKMAYSDDGGATWTAVANPQFSTTTILSMQMSNDVSNENLRWLYAVGESGKMAYSGDGGVTWTAMTSGFGSSHIRAATYSLLSVYGIVAVGDSGKMYGGGWNGMVLENQPLSTTAIYAIASGYVGSVIRNVVAGASGKMAYSDDNGATWTAVTDAVNRVPWMIHHLDGDDYTLYQFKTQSAAYVIPRNFEPVYWDKHETDVTVERVDLQQWADGDFIIGQQITGGQYAGYYVSEVCVLGGKFPSFAGGNRPPYIYGATAGDIMREIYAYVKQGYSSDGYTVSGAVRASGSGSRTATNASDKSNTLEFRNSFTNITGPENSPRTLSAQYWRLVSL